MKIDGMKGIYFSPDERGGAGKNDEPEPEIAKQPSSSPPPPALEYFRVLMKRESEADSMESLGEVIRRASRESPEVLIPLCSDPSIRRQVIAGFYNLADISPKFLPVLLVGLKDKYPDNLYAIDAVAKLQGEAKEAVPILVELLKHGEPDVRGLTVSALGNIGDNQESVISGVVDLLKNEENHFVRERASYALTWLCPEKGVPELLKILETDKTPSTVTCIALSIEEAGPAAKSAVPKLIELINESDENNYNVKALINALGSIGPEAASAIPLLTLFSEDENLKIRSAASNALQKIAGNTVD